MLQNSQSGFYKWISMQTNRKDWIGDLARDIEQDSTYPRAAYRPKPIKTYLRNKGACIEALEAFDAAFLEWLRS